MSFKNAFQKLPFFVGPRIYAFLRKYRRCKSPHAARTLLLINGIFYPPAATVACLARLLKIPYVVVPHDPYSPEIFERKTPVKWTYFHLFEQPLLRRAAAIRVLDTRQEAHLRRLGINRPVFDVPNGMPGQHLAPDRPLAWRSEGATRIIFLGRIDSHNKGLDLLLHAFAALRAQVQAELVIQGPDWGDRRFLELLAWKLGLVDCIGFREPDYERSAVSIIHEHDIFCLPSRFEGFSIAALEALLAARVLLVTEVAGIAPHVSASGAGLVVQSETSSICNGLRELVSRRAEWKRMGLAGRAYALEHLTWDRAAERALQQYLRLVEDRDSP